MDLPRLLEHELLHPNDSFTTECIAQGRALCQKNNWALGIVAAFLGKKDKYKAQQAATICRHLNQEDMNMFLTVGICCELLRKQFHSLDWTKDERPFPVEAAVYIGFVQFVNDEKLREAADQILQARFAHTNGKPMIERGRPAPEA